MLTLDLVRVRRSKGTIQPRYVKESPKMLEKAAMLIEFYKAHVGKTRGELDESIKDSIGDGTDFLTQRGFSKLLSDRSDFVMEAPLDPKLVRQKIFEAASKVHPVAMVPDLHHQFSREDLIAQVAAELEMTPAQIETSLYADLQDAYVLSSFEEMPPEDLLRRYNVALAQAVLFRASELHIELQDTSAKRLRQLVRYLKFFRLIAQIIPTEGGYRFVVDGPNSIFRFCQKYGLQMANFLPALLLCDDWKLEAQLQWDDKRDLCTFSLDGDCGLHSFYPDKGVYVTEEEKYFRKRWKDFELEWTLKPNAKIMRLGSKEIMISDYAVSHPDGRQVQLEIVGFWHRHALMRKLEAVQEHGKDHLILAVPSRLRVSEEELPDSHAAVYFYKDVIQPKRIVELAQRLTS